VSLPTSSAGAAPTATRRLRFAEERAVGAILAAQRHGGGDPAFRVGTAGRVSTWWLGWRTPEGSATLRLDGAAVTDAVEASAWGSGADWALSRVPELLGDADDTSGFVAYHPVIAEAARRFPGYRVPRSGLVLQTLVPIVLEQKVTGKEAFAAYRTLVRRFGEPAPGPAGQRGLRVPPTAAQWAAVPSWEWLRAGVDGGRSRPAVTAVRYAGRLEECLGLAPGAARARMESLPGIGRWSSAEVAQRALGDADAVSVGDYHVAKDIGWAMTGAPVDDDGMLELLEPYRGHRFRVQRLIELSGIHRPRRGPRMAPRGHLPVRR
jgi:3-methyladenine DNA glycosylase/8-oxoguanine DNA glycosylase